MRRDTPIFYDDKIETMSKSDLNALQLTRLKWQVDRCYHRSDFYRERFNAVGVSPADIKTLDDIRKFPFVRKAELREEQAQHPFLGRFTVAPAAAFREVHPSTGTTGTPVNTIWSAADVQYITEVTARTLWSIGVRPVISKGGYFAKCFCVWTLGGGVGILSRTLCRGKNRLPRDSNRCGVDRATD